MIPYRDHVGIWIREERERRGWTLPMMAAKSGVSKGHLSLIERGLTDPCTRIVRNIARALDLTASDIMQRWEVGP